MEASHDPLLDEPTPNQKQLRLPALNEAQLTAWLTGRWLPLSELVVMQFANRREQATLNWPARPPLTPPLATLALPRDCRVTAATLTITIKSAGELPAKIRLGVGGEPGPGLPVTVAAAGAPVVITEGLADLINAWLPRAPINDNGSLPCRCTSFRWRRGGDVARTPHRVAAFGRNESAPASADFQPRPVARRRVHLATRSRHAESDRCGDRRCRSATRFVRTQSVCRAVPS